VRWEGRCDRLAELASSVTQYLCQRFFYSPIKRATIVVEIYGNCRGDLDNLAGAVLDALVKAKIILDDRLSCIPTLNVKHIKAQERRVVVRVNELEQ
jgi:Holliday junction resolvase RusA-like endonuclease